MEVALLSISRSATWRPWMMSCYNFSPCATNPAEESTFTTAAASTFPLLRMSLYKEIAVYIMCITILIITLFVTINLLNLIQCCWIRVHCYYIVMLSTETDSRYLYITYWIWQYISLCYLLKLALDINNG